MAKSFTEKLDAESMKYFTELTKKPYSAQAVAFLNAYWHEVKQEAEFIFTVSWEIIKYADMHSQGISLLYNYKEGSDVDFDIGLYFYEQLVKFLEDPKNANWGKAHYPLSQAVMMTSITRKQELRDKVDVNFDGRVSFLEYLLYQYQSVANPADFCHRSMGHDEHVEIKKARELLEDVNKKIAAYEKEKDKLTEESKHDTVKGKGALNLLAQLGASPLGEELNTSLIKAEAALRSASKKFGGQTSEGAGSDGAIWWMNRDLQEKQKRYGRNK